MKAVYLKCHHGIEKSAFFTCKKCAEEQNQYRLQAINAVKEEDKRIPILRGCNNTDGCFCTGKCKEVIGYYE